MKRASLSILLVALTVPSWAEQNKNPQTTHQMRVDVLNGALLVDAADTIDSIVIARHYNSRSLYSGLFGAGWCADIELRLAHITEAELQLLDCTNPAGAISFNFNSGLHRYQSLQYPQFAIERRGVRGFRLFGHGQTADFDNEGHLIQQGPYLFSYRNPQSIEIRRSDNFDRAIVQLDAEQAHVVSLQGARSHILKYEIADDRLKKVSRAIASEKPQAEYQYDDAFNLVHISDGSRHLTTKVSYESDLVTSVEDSSCKKTLNYSLDEQRSKKTAVVRTDCANQPRHEQSFDFFYHLGPNSTHVLDSTKVTETGGHS